MFVFGGVVLCCRERERFAPFQRAVRNTRFLRRTGPFDTEKSLLVDPLDTLMAVLIRVR